MNTIQLAKNARDELDGSPDEYVFGEDTDSPGWECRMAFIGTADELCPCRGKIDHGSVLVENKSRCGRFWSSLERQLGKRGLTVWFGWDDDSGYYGMERRKMEPPH